MGRLPVSYLRGKKTQTQTKTNKTKPCQQNMLGNCDHIVRQSRERDSVSIKYLLVSSRVDCPTRQNVKDSAKFKGA